ncbi:MAG: PTS sugar transporter subunit IIC [Candidatus Eremiobacteraeota bacterium]|nr:PTS sugar transporter subunit IIC [Candidatus Eremiobacteraeota bacterium]
MLPWSFVGLGVGLAAFMLARASGTFLERLYASFAPAFGVMSFVFVVLLTFEVARRRLVPWSIALPTATTAFALSLPFANAHSAVGLLRALGSSGLFLAMLVAIVSVAVLRVARDRFGAVIGTASGAVLIAGAALFAFLHGFSMASALALLLSPLAGLGDSLSALILLTLTETALWAVGIHGPALLAPIVLPVYMGLQAQNTEALAHHAPLPHIVTVSLFLFVFPGGAGATLPLVLLLLRSRVARVRRVALAALGPSICNANEPLMFGLPVVFNPLLAVPYIVTPLVLALVSYLAVAHGLVARPALYIPSSVPAFANVFLATKDWRACVLVLLNIVTGIVIYAPFVSAYEKRERAREEALGHQ